MSYVIAVIDNGRSITREFPDVPPDRYSDLLCAADYQLSMYRAAATRSAQALTSCWAPGGASILATELVCPDKQWAFNGTACACLNDAGGEAQSCFCMSPLNLPCAANWASTTPRSRESIFAGCSRLEPEGLILDQLLCKIMIEELPDIQAQAVAAAGRSTFQVAMLWRLSPAQTVTSTIQ